MWPAVSILAALVALVLFLRSHAGRTRRRGILLTTGIAAAVSVVGIVPLVGIPGAIVYELSAPWLRLLLGSGYAELGDGAWPAALVLTLTWPSSLVVAYAVAWGPLRNRPRWARWTTMVVVPYAVGVALSLWAQLSAAGS